MHIRDTTEQDHQVFLETVHTAFGIFLETPTEAGGLWWSAIEMDRGVLAIAANGRAVGTASAYSFELTLPGGATMPVGGVNAVSVLPTHRRQGVLTAMMRHQLTTLRARGEAIAVLMCSEAVIYRRYGYGPATFSEHLTVDAARSTFAPARSAFAPAGSGFAPAGSAFAPARSAFASARSAFASAGSGTTAPAGEVEVLAREACGELLEEVYDRYRRARPGALSRPRRWWASRAGEPPISSAPRYVLVHRDADGTPDGYASYVIEHGVMTVDEVIALGDETAATLSRFLLGHDLVSKIVFKHVPADDPLRWQLADFRAARPAGTGDALWLRLLDVPTALTARGWLTDGELVLDVEDEFLGEHHRYLLTIRDGKAACVPTDQEPDLSLDISDLGSIYLGGAVPSTLVRAGHIRAHNPAAAARTDRLFQTELLPHCVHRF